MNKLKHTLILLLLPLLVQAADWPQRIEVYVNGQTPISGIQTARSKGVQVDVLDVEPAAALEQLLSRNLPNDQAKAAYVARNRLQRMPPDSKASAVLAVTARESARRFGVVRYPAIVIDGQVVILEESDIRRAVRLWRGLK